MSLISIRKLLMATAFDFAGDLVYLSVPIES